MTVTHYSVRSPTEIMCFCFCYFVQSIDSGWVTSLKNSMSSQIKQKPTSISAASEAFQRRRKKAQQSGTVRLWTSCVCVTESVVWQNVLCACICACVNLLVTPAICGQSSPLHYTLQTSSYSFTLQASSYNYTADKFIQLHTAVKFIQLHTADKFIQTAPHSR